MPALPQKALAKEHFIFTIIWDRGPHPFRLQESSARPQEAPEIIVVRIEPD
jgi:hypothetical protein